MRSSPRSPRIGSSLIQALGLTLALVWLPASLAADIKPTTVRADVPQQKNDPSGKFLEKHAAFLARGQAGPVGLLFLGDSITAAWATCLDIWEKYFGAHQPANFGIAGDETQHVLWRITHGGLDGIAPRAIVLLIGTNNTGRHTAPEIAPACARPSASWAKSCRKQKCFCSACCRAAISIRRTAASRRPPTESPARRPRRRAADSLPRFRK